MPLIPKIPVVLTLSTVFSITSAELWTYILLSLKRWRIVSFVVISSIDPVSINRTHSPLNLLILLSLRNRIFFFSKENINSSKLILNTLQLYFWDLVQFERCASHGHRRLFLFFALRKRFF